MDKVDPILNTEAVYYSIQMAQSATIALTADSKPVGALDALLVLRCESFLDSLDSMKQKY